MGMGVGRIIEVTWSLFFIALSVLILLDVACALPPPFASVLCMRGIPLGAFAEILYSLRVVLSVLGRYPHSLFEILPELGASINQGLGFTG